MRPSLPREGLQADSLSNQDKANKCSTLVWLFYTVGRTAQRGSPEGHMARSYVAVGQ